MDNKALNSLRVFIVEDEELVAMLVEDTLLDLGCSVAGKAVRLEEALEKVAALDFDVAIVDINLNGQLATPVAELLIRRGIPFLFATGYGPAGVPDAFRAIPVLRKPFRREDMERVLIETMARRRST